MPRSPPPKLCSSAGVLISTPVVQTLAHRYDDVVAAGAQKKRTRPRAAPIGEKRAARERSISAATRARIARALSERLYLIGRTDHTTVSASGLESLREDFTVLGSTANVYTVSICRHPKGAVGG